MSHVLYARCPADDIYLHPRYLCDNIVHCLLSHDDESVCDEVSVFIKLFVILDISIKLFYRYCTLNLYCYYCM